MADLIHFNTREFARVWISKGDGTFDIKKEFPDSTDYDLSANGYKFLIGDFNGDGKSDLAHFANEKYIHLWISKGDGDFDILPPFPKSDYKVDSNNYMFKVGDFDGDHRDDLIHFANNEYVHVWKSKLNVGDEVQTVEVRKKQKKYKHHDDL